MQTGRANLKASTRAHLLKLHLRILHLPEQDDLHGGKFQDTGVTLFPTHCTAAHHRIPVSISWCDFLQLNHGVLFHLMSGGPGKRPRAWTARCVNVILRAPQHQLSSLTLSTGPRDGNAPQLECCKAHSLPAEFMYRVGNQGGHGLLTGIVSVVSLRLSSSPQGSVPFLY